VVIERTTLIIEKTEGNPFFMEETVLVLFDEWALKRNGAVRLTRLLNQLKIPPTVQRLTERKGRCEKKCHRMSRNGPDL
jgi:predicted ATPase